MNIELKKDGTALTIILDGRLDTLTAPELEDIVEDNIAGVTDLTFDLDKIVYLSSAGLRVFMGAQKIMIEQGSMELINVHSDILDILDMVGLTDVFTIR